MNYVHKISKIYDMGKKMFQCIFSPFETAKLVTKDHHPFGALF